MDKVLTFLEKKGFHVLNVERNGNKITVNFIDGNLIALNEVKFNFNCEKGIILGFYFTGIESNKELAYQANFIS